jgi:hypothetical protein
MSSTPAGDGTETETHVAITGSDSCLEEVTASRSEDVLSLAAAAPLGPELADCDGAPPAGGQTNKRAYDDYIFDIFAE